MKKILTTIIFSCYILVAICQIKLDEIRAYYYQDNKLEYYLQCEIKDSALYYAHNLSKSNLPISIYSYRGIAKAYYLNGDSKNGDMWLLKDITLLGYSSITSMQNRFKKFEHNFGKEYYYIVNNFDSLNENSKLNKNKKQIELISMMYLEDQADRESTDASFDTSSIYYKRLIKNDKKHYIILDSLFKNNNNFPNILELNDQSINRILFLMIHLYDRFDMKIIFNRLDYQTINGLLPNYITPLLKDKIQIYNRNKICYGMFMNSNNDGSYMKLEDVKIVDSLRDYYFLPPLYIDAQMKKAKLPESYIYSRKW